MGAWTQRRVCSAEEDGLEGLLVDLEPQLKEEVPEGKWIDEEVGDTVVTLLLSMVTVKVDLLFLLVDTRKVRNNFFNIETKQVSRLCK